jgi:hypothetical protein
MEVEAEEDSRARDTTDEKGTTFAEQNAWSHIIIHHPPFYRSLHHQANTYHYPTFL